MKKLWSISTTVRNPERLRNFLITLKEIEGKVWNKETQKEFQIRLIKNRFYGFGSSQFYSDLEQKYIDLLEDINHNITLKEAREIFEAKNYEDPAMRGRTSFKPLQKMGLAIIESKKIKITSLGEYLLSDDYDLGELFFKSFLKWQYPNPIDRDFKDENIYNIKPFIAVLHLINEVNKLCKIKNIKVKGISKIEFEIFAQSLLNYNDISIYANKIIEFRLKYEKLKDFKEKQNFIEETKKIFLNDFSNKDFNNIKDYADNTIRYFRLTRYLYIRGGGYYIDLEPRRSIEIQKLLETYNGSADNFTKDDYIKYLSDITLPKLPWENEKEIKKIKQQLIKDILDLENKLEIKKDISNLNIEELRQYRKELQDMELKLTLQDITKIDEVISKLQNIRKLDLKPSIALEKYITMALNIINDAIKIKANSLVGDDNEFIFTAPANKPDIECYYQTFDSICEVTMLTGRDQWHNEGQPVMRHLRDFEKNKDKETYCIFVAPKLHRDTINTFWFSVKYEYEGKAQKIVPLTINQIIDILLLIKDIKSKNQKLKHTEFKRLLDNIIELKNISVNSEEWIKNIPHAIKQFKENLCS